jgi:hypothetical protein
LANGRGGRLRKTITLALALAAVPSLADAQQLTHPQYEELLTKQLEECQQGVRDSQDGVLALVEMAMDDVNIICNHRTPTPRDPPKCVKARAALLAAVKASQPKVPRFVGDLIEELKK